LSQQRVIKMLEKNIVELKKQVEMHEKEKNNFNHDFKEVFLFF
jgi:hypothetical protein